MGARPVPQPNGLTMLLRRMSQGDQEAATAAAEEVYAELRRLAGNVISKERQNHSLQPTLLVNEAFLRLLRGEAVEFQDRKHFYVLCARMMRRIVVDHFRERGAQKRPSSGLQVPLEQVVEFAEDRRDEALAIDQALNKLQAFDARAALVVELRYFAGLSEPEAAEVLEVGVRTVRRDWLAAQAWLKRYLSNAEAS